MLRSAATNAYQREATERTYKRNSDRHALVDLLERTFGPEWACTAELLDFDGEPIARIDDVLFRRKGGGQYINLVQVMQQCHAEPHEVNESLWIVLVCECGEIIESARAVASLADIGEVLDVGLWDAHDCDSELDDDDVPTQTRCKVLTGQLLNIDQIVNAWLETQAGTVIDSLIITAQGGPLSPAYATIVYEEPCDES